MARRGFPGGGMPNMNNMLKQAQKMQKQMEQMQEEIEKREVEASAGGGAVTVKVNGKKEMQRPLTVMDSAGRVKLLFTPKLKGEFRIGGSLKGKKESYVAGNLQGTALLDNGRLINIANIPAFYNAMDASF